MPLLVDEILRHDAMRRSRKPRGVSLRGVNFDSLEPLSQLLAQSLESLGWTERVAGKAKSKNLAAPVLDPIPDHLQILVGHVKRTLSFRTKRKGQRRL